SRPLIPGSRTSSTRQQGPSGIVNCRNSAVEANALAVNPTDRNSRASASRRSASSSMTKTVGSVWGGLMRLPFLDLRLLAFSFLRLPLINSGLCGGQQHAEDRAVRLGRCDRELSVVTFDDHPADRQPQTHSGCLRGDEGVENILELLRVNSGAGILNI